MTHRSFTTFALLLAGLLSSSCKKSDQPAPAATEKPSTPSKLTTTPPAADSPFASWDLPARTAAFQGAHVTPSEILGKWAAWEVKGDKAATFDHGEEKTFSLRVKSPCEVELIEAISSTENMTTTSHYTIKDGAIVMGLGDAGSRRGPEAVACISNKLLTLNAKGVCLEWSESMFDKNKWESKPAVCSWTKAGDKEVFSANINNRDTQLAVDGDALMSEQFAGKHSEKAADYAAAKAALETKNK